MRNQPSVTVAIFNYNGLEDTKKCISSILKTKYKNYKILVIDDNSQIDETKYLKSAFKSKKIIYIRSNRNLGFAKRANQVLKSATSKYVVLLNNDTIVDSEWLRHLVDVAESDSTVAVCQSKLRWMSYPNYFEYAGACGGYLDRFGFPYTRGRVLFTLEEDLGQYDDVTEIFWACGAAILIKVSIAKKMGGFDEDLYSYQEEIDFCWRVKKDNLKIKVSPKSIVYHKGNASWGKQLPKKTFLVHRNNLILLIKHLDLSELIYIFPIRMFLDYLGLVYYLKKGRFSFAYSLLKAHLNVLTHLAYWFNKRSKGNNPLRSPFSILWEYYVLGKKRYTDLFFQRAILSKTVSYEDLFREQERLFDVTKFRFIWNRINKIYINRGERTNTIFPYLMPIFYQHRSVYRWSRKFVKDKVVFDLGCGVGYGSFILARKAKKVLAVDIDKNSIKRAQSLYHQDNLVFRNSDILDLPTNIAKPDVIVALQVIEHLKEPSTFLQLVNEKLREKGTLLISTPNRVTQGYNENPYHTEEYSAEELYKLLNKFYSKVRIYGLFGDRVFEDYEAERKKQVMKIMRLDPFKLRRLLPRKIRLLLFEALVPWVRKKVMKNRTEITNKISEKNYMIKDMTKGSMDLIAVCQK